MLLRKAAADVEAGLARQAVVALIGPRQSGKTTLALAMGSARDALYLDLEDIDDRNKLASPSLFFEAASDRLIILDEIHRMPGLFEVLRGVVDKARRKGQGKGRFLVLGSAAVELLRQTETLAGRIAYVELTPFLATEVALDRPSQDRLWLRGGFPESFLAVDDAESFVLRKDFIRTYLERDVPMFGPRIPAVTMERLWTMLAHNQGTLLNASIFARSLDVSAQSITRYINLLCDLMLVRRLPTLLANTGKRLAKSPKIYVRDSGLVHALLGLSTAVQLSGHPVAGLSWEGFAMETLLNASGERLRASFCRTAAGAEVDLVVELPGGKVWAIEIKRGASAKPGRGFYEAVRDIRPERAFVVHAGHDRYPIAQNVEGIGLLSMAKEIAAAKLM
jgi:uncharacterized protein